MPLLSKSDEFINFFPSSYFAALSRLRCAARLRNSMWLHARHGICVFKMFARSDSMRLAWEKVNPFCHVFDLQVRALKHVSLRPPKKLIQFFRVVVLRFKV